MAEPSTEQIVRRVLAGETEAFGKLVTQHEPLVAAVCHTLLGDHHEAEDAAQDTFVRAYLSLRQLKDYRRVKAWLRRVAYSVCMNRLQRRVRPPRVQAMTPEALDAINAPADVPGPAQLVEARELAGAVLGSIANLPEKYRRPIQMFYLDGASSAEIAEKLGLNAGAVRTRLSRGRQMLRPALARHWPVEVLSRSKQPRRWLPLKLEEQRETPEMKLTYEPSRIRLLRGDAEVSVRTMTRDDIPALRRFDDELTAALDEANAQGPPGGQRSLPGGPWSDDQWLAEHFDKYKRRGGMTLLAEDARRIVGFADLWPADEPEPFGRSLNVECIDYFREYFLGGLETLLLVEAEKVPRAAGLPALDIGTNTCSGEYTSLRRFGLKVFYEYDHVQCRCGSVPGSRPEKKALTPDTADLAGLIKASHWSPTDFNFRGEDEPTYLAELSWPGRRAIIELWHFRAEHVDHLPVPANPPNRSELFVQPEALTSAADMTEILAECAALAGELGAEQISLPCPSEVELSEGRPEVLGRHFAFAWLRKRL